MAIHPDFLIDGERMEGRPFPMGERMGHVMVIDIGKCGSKSWQAEGLKNAVTRHPGVNFVICHLLAPNGKQGGGTETGSGRAGPPNVWFDLASSTP